MGRIKRPGPYTSIIRRGSRFDTTDPIKGLVVAFFSCKVGEHHILGEGLEVLEPQFRGVMP